MPTVEELSGEVRALRERLTKLSEASLRVSESLDLDTVLREMVERARSLTGAGCSVIATMDASGELEDLVAAGMGPEELELSLGLELWAYLREVPGPLRVDDVAAHLSALGFPEDPLDPLVGRSFLGTPIRHRGVQLGNFFVGDQGCGRGSRARTRRCLCSSPRRPEPRSPTHAPSGMSSGRAPTLKR